MQEPQETRVGSLGWEDPLEQGMAIHSSILAWRIPWKEEPSGLQSIGPKELDTIVRQLNTHEYIFFPKNILLVKKGS